jgi:hypothetical protein
MEQRDARSLQQIKRETELTRANLMETVDQLRTTVGQRMNADAIKGEVSQYVRGRGEQLWDDTIAAARRNPMQAVALGASIAFPLLRVARAIPVPIWMVGAGLFLASSKTGQQMSQKAVDTASEYSSAMMDRARDIRDQASEAARDIRDQAMGTARDIRDQASGAADTVKSFASENIDRVKDAVSGGTDQPAYAGGPVGQSGQFEGGGFATATAYPSGGLDRTGARGARDVSSDAAEAGRRALEAGKNMGLHAARTVQDTASNLGERAGKTFFETLEKNPLLVAGVGLFVGGLIASALPRSDIEDRVVGDAADSVKRRADEAAAGAVRAAQDAAKGAYEEAGRQAEAEGLTPQGLGAAAQDVEERLRHVAEAAVTTAFEPAQNGNDQQHRSTHGENENG